jgi:enolase-phosphatase E1
MSITFDKITSLLLDIEGTVCPITFVKDGLFPYFLKKLPDVLSTVEFPLDGSTPISQALAQFPEEHRHSKKALQTYIVQLVKDDIKEKSLKSLQGLVWKDGYVSGEIKAPLYKDAIDSIKQWYQTKKVYIYSSGSVQAQKLLFGHVDIDGESVDMNALLSGYFDITTSGYKFEQSSYESILKDIQTSGEEVLFLSDNVKEVEAAQRAGLRAAIVIRPGNAPLTEEVMSKYTLVDDFTKLSI